ncbi:ADP-ribosylation factor-like protein 6-interacting protein 4 isoform X3 [Colletes gigas]|uniref:ADP-ribosylation factor-like protein 6-interacting protein 4 isoform X3 n=1 Tax=Colletes gigas TaxID=935657 RepID=UPI001C9BB7AC|nr:ADP-ribosylation factor-like protein 6-interacting protein 4 isoform X3 [Colletes gigas]
MSNREKSDFRSEQCSKTKEERDRRQSVSSQSDNSDLKKKRRNTCSKDKRKKSKHRSSSSSSSSSTSSESSSSSSSTVPIHQKMKENKKLKKSSSKKKSRNTDKSKESVSKDVVQDISEKSKAMAPMTKEEWEKKQSIVRRVYDEETGRYRLIKGDGEVLEEIVSRERHKEINKQATKGDGDYFQARLKTNVL